MTGRYEGMLYSRFQHRHTSDSIIVTENFNPCLLLRENLYPALENFCIFFLNEIIDKKKSWRFILVPMEWTNCCSSTHEQDIWGKSIKRSMLEEDFSQKVGSDLEAQRRPHHVKTNMAYLGEAYLLQRLPPASLHPPLPFSLPRLDKTISPFLSLSPLLPLSLSLSLLWNQTLGSPHGVSF